MKTDAKADFPASFGKSAVCLERLIEPQSESDQESGAGERIFVKPASFSAVLTDEIDQILLEDQSFFQRKPEESPENFTALKQYLNLGPARTLEQLSKKTNEMATVLFDLCKTFDWRARAKAFDNYILERKRNILTQYSANADLNRKFREEKLRDQQWEVHKLLLKLGLEALNGIHEVLRPAEALKYLAMSDKLGRAACATECETHITEAPVDHDINQEWESLLEKAYGHRVA